MLSQFCKTCTQFCARHNEILQRALLPRNFSKLLRLGGILRSLGFEFGTRWREAVIAFVTMYVQISRMIPPARTASFAALQFPEISCVKYEIAILDAKIVILK